MKVADRPAAFRNYASLLVDVGQGDTATKVLQSDQSFDAELVATVMDHATYLGEARCVASLGKLVIPRLPSSTSSSPLRHTELRMAARAAIQVGGDDAAGALVIGERRSGSIDGQILFNSL